MKKRYQISLLVIGVLLIMCGVTYAYFSATVLNNGNTSNVTTGTMAITFTDGDTISLNNAIPGSSVTKSFSIKNTGTLSTTYDVYFSELLNTFVDTSDLVYTLTSSSSCTATNVEVPHSYGSKLISACSIEPNTTQTFTLTITFKETNDAQNDNQGALFNTKLEVNQCNSYVATVTSTMYWVVSDTNADSVADHLEISSNDVSATGLAGGNFSSDTRFTTSSVPWESYTSKITSANVTGFVVPIYTQNWFYSFSSLTSVDLIGLNTSNVESMYGMFGGCSKVTSLDLSHFDTSKVEYFTSMFYGCKALLTLDLSNFNTESAINMSQMFRDCQVMTSLNVSSFDTTKVTDMSQMFYSLYKLNSLDVSNFDTSSVNNMSNMFGGCFLVTTLDVSKFDTSKVTTMYAMFSNCIALKSVDVSGFKTTNVESMSQMFFNCNALTSVDVSKFDTSKVTNMSGMFQYCYVLANVNLSNFNTALVTDMSSMFSNCKAFTSLNFSSFNTAKVTDMSLMFEYCIGLSSLDLSTFNTAKVTNMSSLFSNSTNLGTITVSSKFVTTAVTSGSSMFYKCTSLVGGNGTAFNSSNTDYTYARVDTSSTPGYFTLKA